MHISKIIQKNVTIMKKALIIGFAIAAIFSSCKKDEVDYAALEQKTLDEYLQINYPKATADNDGIYTVEATEGTGISPLPESYVLVNYTVSRISGPLSKNVFDTNNETTARDNRLYSEQIHYTPTIWKANEMIKGIKLALNKMKEGGKAKYILPSNLAYGDKEIGYLPAYSTLIVEIELIKVIDNIDAYESNIILKHIEESPLEFNLTQSGVYLAITKDGEGEKYKNGAIISLTCLGKYLDGKVFNAKSTFELTLDQNQVIPGFEAAVKELKPGSKATVIIPYKMGYGTKGKSPIKGYETLIFELEMPN